MLAVVIRLCLNQTGMVVTDTVNVKGMTYAADYSANYTARSIVDKAYVDAQGGGGSETLAQTLALGNVTGGTDIVITDGDTITGTVTSQALNLSGALAAGD